MPQDPLNIDIPGVEFKVDNNGSRQIVQLPEQYYTDVENGHRYVDLGLSVKWATCNIGADSPEMTGGKYAWGEVATKSDYTWQNYRFNNGGEGYWDVKLSKYNSDSKLGPVDMHEVLEPEDDAAHVNWGGNWRIPTAQEFQELANNCTFIWSTLNGCEGCLIVSNKPGYTDRFIFLPTTRKRTDGVGTSDGYYWSSTTNLTDRRGSVNPGPCSSYTFLIWNMYNLVIWINLENQRSFGLTIRPVCPKEEITTDDFEGLEMTTQDDPLGSCDDLVPIDSLSYSAQRLKEKITIEKTPNGDVWRVSRDIYEYLSELTRKTEYKGYDVTTTEIKGKEESHTIKHWNKTDSIVEHFNYNKNGEFVRDKVITYTYDSRARLISKKTEYVDADNPVYPQKLNMTFSYDRKGMLKKKMEGAYVGKRIQNDFLSQFACDDTMMTVRTFHVIRYSNKGKKNLLPRKELYSTWTSHFNEQGQLILYEKIFNHNEWEIIRYQYDEQGKTSKEEHYHKGPRDSVERLQAIYEYEYKYYMK